jgi:hypothetical protein
VKALTACAVAIVCSCFLSAFLASLGGGLVWAQPFPLKISTGLPVCEESLASLMVN